MTAEGDPAAPESTIDVGALVHSSAGIISLLMGGLMYFYAWALPVFAGLMILSAVSAFIISWRSDAWVPGHWLAMLPIIGIAVGYFLAPWGYTFAYVCLWLAFIHFVVRGVQMMREGKQQG
jgi:uncharacterized membrane protein HdeD (DUF308 family)